MVLMLFFSFKIYFLLFAGCEHVKRIKATPLSSKPLFNEYVSKERGRSDTRSLPFLRETQLYSRSSRGHLRILGRKVDATGKDGDVYSKLIIESDNFGRVKIRGYKSSYYLCIRNKDGRLIGRKKATKSKCVFYERYAANSFTEFKSAFKHNWMITVSKRGTTRPSYKGRSGQKSVQFIQRPSRFIIEANDVGQPYVDGLSQHIAKLLRNFRSQIGNKANINSGKSDLYGSRKRKTGKRKKKKHLKRRKSRKKGKRRLKKMKQRSRLSKRKRKKKFRRKKVPAKRRQTT